MGIGYTIDTPLKVSQYGIDSVISLVDDILLEKLRKMYCGKYRIPYEEITDKTDDFRAKRITSYLNLIKRLAEKKFEKFKTAAIERGKELKEYMNFLPDYSTIKQQFRSIRPDYLSMGSIDVNIMTKVDRANYKNGVQLTSEYNDAHAALRGYANSDLSSTIIFSAGMNPSLYGYIEKFEDFFPDAKGLIKKKIAIKVSDYRSALIQGKFLAKKGLWVSEFRIESGLNCGGHAFATDGYLLGPILAEFRDKRKELTESMHENYVSSISTTNRPVSDTTLPIKITAQGGVGTAEEHKFLLEHYHLDSVGWGTPFLLVPQVTNVDEYTLKQLTEATEDDLYLSGISPLGVPFYSLRGNTKDLEKLALIEKGRPGSLCVKKYVAINNEYTQRSICTASRQYQILKLKELDKEELSPAEYHDRNDKIVEKSCICVGLGTSVLLVNNMDTKEEGPGVSICPGPDMAYFSKIMSLKEITDHIYGRANMVTRTDRPNIFINELNIYIDFLKNKIGEARDSMNEKKVKYLSAFVKNLNDGIDYYLSLFVKRPDIFEETRSGIIIDLNAAKNALSLLDLEIEDLCYENTKRN